MIDRSAFYEQRATVRPAEAGRYYHHLLKHYFRFLIPENSSVLEIGCGVGDLLAALKPSRGLGADFSGKMIELAQQRHPQLEFRIAEATGIGTDEKFDYIIASDLVNDLPDVQHFLEVIQRNARPDTRLVINFFNNLWRPILAVAEKLGLKSPNPPQNWLSLSDVKALLHLGGWEVVKSDARILWPAKTFLLGSVLNRWLAALLKHLCLTVFVGTGQWSSVREFSEMAIVVLRMVTMSVSAPFGLLDCGFSAGSPQEAGCFKCDTRSVNGHRND